MKVKNLKYKLQQIIDFLDGVNDDREVPTVSNTYFVSADDGLFLGITSEGYTSLKELKEGLSKSKNITGQLEEYFDTLWGDSLDDYFSNYSKEAVYSAFLKVIEEQEFDDIQELDDILNDSQFGSDNMVYMLEDIQKMLDN